jgi:RNA polymerase sigma-70 factor (ECF subfamily)
VDAATDEQLLADYLGGDARGFELLVRRHSRELYQFVTRFTGSSTLAEDIVQDAFLQVHLSGHRFDTTKRFRPWLFTIAANKARDQMRRRGRRREVSLDAAVDNEQDAKQRYIHLLTADTSAPDQDLLVDEKRRLVRDVVEQMPDRLAEVLVLAYYHRFPYKEIGDILDIPLGTVKSRLHAAVAWFSEHYRRAVADREKTNLSDDDRTTPDGTRKR